MPGWRAWAIALLIALVIPSGVRGESAGDLVRRGNASYESGSFDEALTLYDEASVSVPESPGISFNRGAVHYRMDDFAAAADAFKEAALHAKDPGLSSRAKFNLGNCAFRKAQRQKDSDLAKAIEHCQESISHYQEAHDLNPDYREAAENIEIVRLYVKVLLDEQKKQQEQQDQQQQDQNQEQQEPKSENEEEQKDQEQDEQNQQDEQESQEEDGNPDQAEDQQPRARPGDTAEDILDEEKENQKQRQPVRPGRVKPVDRDW